MTEQLINGIYNNCINTVLENIDESLREKISLEYKKHLLNDYEDILEPDDDINMMISICTQMEIKRWQKKTADEKLSILFEDKFFNKLIEISNIGFKHAQRKIGYLISNKEYNPDISQEQADDYINKMNDLFEQVQPYNKDEATIYLSEGTLDFGYASNMTDNMSLRAARMR